jgi:hypothetical protein
MSSQSFDGDTDYQTDLSEDDAFDILSNSRRRYVVQVLKDEAGTIQIGPLAEQIAAWENNVAVADLSHDQRKRVYTALQQSHLPKMDDAGIIDFDKDRGVVQPTTALENVDTYLDRTKENHVPWSMYYLGLSVSGIAFLATKLLGILPVTVLSGHSIAVSFLFVCSLFALVHYSYEREWVVPPVLDDSQN